MLPSLLREVDRLGFEVFTTGDLNLNLIAQRARVGARGRGELPDLLSVEYRERGAWTSRSWPCSTVPGWSGLERPANPGGVAVLRPGQYRQAYSRGLHKGRPALVQVGPVTIQRDSDHDRIVDPGAVTYDGWFGINIHDDVGLGSEASEGCIVIGVESRNELLELVQRAELRWGGKFTLTLIEV